MVNLPSDADYASIRDTLPRLWWSVYQGCLTAGFSQRQAFVILQTYILSQGSGVQSPDETGPDADDGGES